jgi:hypothetical protein
MGLLAFIRTAHYWTVLHPELSFEDDVRDLLMVKDELARLLLEDQEAARCDMGPPLPGANRVSRIEREARAGESLGRTRSAC